MPADWQLSALANYILRTMDFDGDHLSEFRLSSSPHGHNALPDPDGYDDHPQPSLDAVFPLPENKKLFFLYDYGASWCFQINRRGRPSAALPHVKYPALLEEQGPKPLAYGDDGYIYWQCHPQCPLSLKFVEEAAAAIRLNR